MSSFKSNENIHKKEDGLYYVVRVTLTLYVHRQNDKILIVDGNNLYCKLCYTILCRYLIKLQKVW